MHILIMHLLHQSSVYVGKDCFSIGAQSSLHQALSLFFKWLSLGIMPAKRFGSFYHLYDKFNYSAHKKVMGHTYLLHMFQMSTNEPQNPLNPNIIQSSLPHCSMVIQNKTKAIHGHIITNCNVCANMCKTFKGMTKIVSKVMGHLGGIRRIG